MHCTPKIFVGALPRDANEASVSRHFSQFGKVLAVKVPRNDDGTSKGFGFITFESPDTAKWLVLDNYRHNKIDGKWVDCKFQRTSEVRVQGAADWTDWRRGRQEGTAWSSHSAWSPPGARGRPSTAMAALGKGEQTHEEISWGRPQSGERAISDHTGRAHHTEEPDNQLRVFVLDPPPASNLPALLAVLVAGESEELCRQAVNIAAQVLQCTAQDVRESDQWMDCKEWYEQTVACVGAELVCPDTSRFHVGSVVAGPFAGLRAVGVGTNFRRLRRACCLSLAATAAVRRQGALPGVDENPRLREICARAMRYKDKLVDVCWSAVSHCGTDGVSLSLGRSTLNLEQAGDIHLRLALRDLSGRESYFKYRLASLPPAVFLLDGLYSLRVSNNIVELYVARAGVWCARSEVAVEVAVDMGSRELRRLRPGELCQQAGRAAVLKEVSEHGPTTVLRTRIEPDGWVSLAEWISKDDDTSEFKSRFHEPAAEGSETGWTRVSDEANHVDYFQEKATEACAELASLQQSLRKSAQESMGDASADPAQLESPEVEKRDVARRDALHWLRNYVRSAEESCISEANQGGCDREHKVREARDMLESLEHGAQLDTREELRILSELRDRARKARIEARRAENDILDARDMEEDSMTISQREKIYQEKRSVAQRVDKEFQRKMAELSRAASDHAPEIMPSILAKASAHIKRELSAMKPLDQSRVVDLFAMERSLAHYDDGLRRMKELSRVGARHQVLATGYGGKPCVLKVFELHEQTSVAAFLKEVVLHKKLEHCPLVVPLRQAFLDMPAQASLRGVLHFDRYPCDLDKWGSTMAREESNPPNTVRDVACKMVQSVAQIHLLGIVHGDLKPSNWLFDRESRTPLLCDFETAKDRGIGGVTMTRVRSTAGPALQTRGWVAPELEADLTRPKSRASDMYALGLSTRFLVDCVSGPPTVVSGVGVLGRLLALVEKMTSNDPHERISAKDAQRDPSLGGASSVPSESPDKFAPPPYWARCGLYHWHQSHFMQQEVQRLLYETTCAECRRYRVATDVWVVKVSRVENMNHWKSFSSRRQELADLASQTADNPKVDQRSIRFPDICLDDTTNEVFLWHGLPAANVPVVAHSGLDERIANCKGLYGAGIYLTDQWCKALQYSRAGRCSIRHKQCGQPYRCNCHGPKRVLLCRALLGAPYYVQARDNLQGHRRPPERRGAGPGMVYDSVIAMPGKFMVAHGRKQVHSEYVLFDRKSVYPEWIIELDWKL